MHEEEGQEKEEKAGRGERRKSYGRGGEGTPESIFKFSLGSLMMPLPVTSRQKYFFRFSRSSVRNHMIVDQPEMEKTSRMFFLSLLVSNRHLWLFISVCQGEHDVGGCHRQISLSRSF